MTTIITVSQQSEITQYINAYRAKHLSPPLSWDKPAAIFSQNWAHYLNVNNTFVHSGTSLYGENLAFFQGYGTDIMSLLKKAVDSWYNEITLYNFAKPGFSDATGHFTCLVWKSSTLFGIGISINTSTSAVNITMNTSPPGNVLGQFQENVLPVTQSSPVPNPSPNPSPVPVPNPSPSPVPYQPIIDKLNNVIQSIQLRQAKNYIINMMNDVIQNIYGTSMTQPTKQQIINQLYNINFMIQRNQNSTIIINSIKYIIHVLLQHA